MGDAADAPTRSMGTYSTLGFIAPKRSDAIACGSAMARQCVADRSGDT